MQRMFRAGVRALLIGSGALVVVSGLLVGTMRGLLLFAEVYRAPLAAELSAALGAPVQIGSLHAQLVGLEPELRLQQVELQIPSSALAPLHLRELRLRLDLLASLRARAPRLAFASVIGARLHLQLGDPGAAIGLALADPSGTLSPLSAQFLFAQGRLRLLDTALTLESPHDPTRPALRLEMAEAWLDNTNDHHRLNLRARLGDGAVDLRVDVQGDPAHPEAWRGAVYLHGIDLELTQLRRYWDVAAALPEGRADLELWGSWPAIGWPSLEGWATLHVRNDDPAPPLRAYLMLRQEATAVWHLEVRDLRWGATSQLAGSFDVRLHQGETLTLEALTQGWRLEELTPVALALPLPEAWHNLLRQAQPQGQIQDLRLRATFPTTGTPDWNIGGQVTQLVLNSAGNTLPGVSGLDLNFRASADSGSVRLRARNAKFEVASLFRAPLVIRRLDGDLTWRREADGAWALASEELVLENADLRTRSRVMLQLPVVGSPVIDMQTDFADGNGSATPRYLPVGILKADAVAWLERAIVAGHVTSGRMLLRGPIHAFPFREQEGRFQVLFGVEGLVMDYDPEWPRLEEVEAEVQFLNAGLQVEVSEARLLESRVRQARIQLADLDDLRRLSVNGRVQGPFADGLRILRETPLAARQGRYVRGLSARGDSEISLDLAIPLVSGELGRVDGRIRWRGAGLVLDDWGLTLDALTGGLRFSEQGIFAHELKARLWEEPVQIDVATLAATAETPEHTRVEVATTLRPERWATHAPHPGWQNFSGATPVRLQLEIGHRLAPPGTAALRYRVESDLQGLAIALPAPLNKLAESRRPSFIAGTLPLNPEHPINAGYGDWRGLFRFDASTGDVPRLQTGEIIAGGDVEPKADVPGLLLHGHIERLDLPAWQTWLTRQAAQLSDNQALRAADLLIDTLNLPTGDVNDLQVTLTRGDAAWELELHAPRLAGNLRVPDRPRSNPILARLAYLRLDAPSTEEIPAPAVPEPLPVVGPDPRLVPALDLVIEQIYLGSQLLGRLTFKAQAAPAGLRLEALVLEGPLLNVYGQGVWAGDATRQDTQIRLKGYSADLGATLHSLGFSSAFSQADVNLETDLRWAAAPQQFNLAQLLGTLKFHIGPGRLLDVNPGVGRLVGLLNLAALQRRLTLDFSDLFGQGFAFDHMDGRFILNAGTAQAENVRIQGPAAEVRISGRTGLLARDYEQTVLVTPELSATLPIAGAIVGGPATAAVLLVAAGLLGPEVNKLLRVQYRVSGPWAEPLITRVVLQNGEWALSNLLGDEEPVKTHVPAFNH